MLQQFVEKRIERVLQQLFSERLGTMMRRSSPSTPVHGMRRSFGHDADGLETRLGRAAGSNPLIFRCGDNGQFKAFAAQRTDAGDGIVFFANAFPGLQLIEFLAETAVGDLEAEIDWLEYGRPD